MRAGAAASRTLAAMLGDLLGVLGAPVSLATLTAGFAGLLALVRGESVDDVIRTAAVTSIAVVGAAAMPFLVLAIVVAAR